MRLESAGKRGLRLPAAAALAVCVLASCAAVCVAAIEEGGAHAAPDAAPPAVHVDALRASKARDGKHVYGMLHVEGAVAGVEMFRASFGGVFPCGAYPLALADDELACAPLRREDVEGSIVIARRGNCSFAVKAGHAQVAGGVALVVVNTEGGKQRAGQGAAEVVPTPITIAVAMASNASWYALHRAAHHRTASGARIRASWRVPREDCAPLLQYSAFVNVSDNSSTGDGEQFVLREQRMHASVPRDHMPLLGVNVSTSVEVMHVHNNDSVQLTEAARLTFEFEMEDAAAGSCAPGLTAQEVAHLRSLALNAPVGVEAVAAMFSGSLLDARTPLVVAPSRYLCENATAVGVGTLAAAAVLGHDGGASAMGNAGTSTWATGRLVVAARGRCSMVHKARVAQAMGAAGVVLINTGIAWDALPSLDVVHAASTAATSDAAFHAAEAVLADAELGAVQAITDADETAEAIRIPVVMVPAVAAAPWFWQRTGAPPRAAMTAAIPDEAAAGWWPLNCVHARLTASRASGEAWDELRSLLANASGSALPSEELHRQLHLQRLLRAHHPSSARGDALRYRVLRQAAEQLGMLRELAALEAGAQWTAVGEDVSNPWWLGRRPDLTVGVTHVPSAVLLGARLPLARFDANDIHVYCRSEGAAAYTVRLYEVEASSSVHTSFAGRIPALLQQQACLERLQLLNAAALGTHLSSFRRETSDDEWRRMMNTWLRSFLVPPADADAVAATFMELSSRFAERKPSDLLRSFAEWVGDAGRHATP